MKKTISVLIAVLLCLAIYPAVYAADAQTAPMPETVVAVEYFADGSYGVTTLAQAGGAGTKGKVTHTKSYTYYDADDTALWTLYLTAAFTYDGTTATCTAASVMHLIYDNAWQVTSETAHKSGNTATGDFTVKRYFLGIPTKTINVTLTMTCSPSGVVS
ncbi:MAG: hypothetical protein IK082_11020 [Oscillospiraceae bacterium]|nr:hypothetical protein [Oscillospiraceae bacterium]